ncbi:Structural maintenance of chromosomes protein 4 [Strongyloides ratti]|uniref:Structural maintenance of chromosomes protein n=1 Tax=Strongyloides ratti TaxID=34506 RepID=A0A090LKC8_STRRB|nr:Structural maintenance of chromosomes protein 4 [Strongyloides ratti]CEF70232.1 Structural maintenance of chromosomes protein 4 [Strongyloides ratti]
MVNISDNDDVMDVSCAGSDNSDNLMDTSDGLFQHEQNFEKNINISDDVVDKNDELLNIVIPPPPEPCMRDDGSGERLVISSIDVENFKSYYGRQTIGPLHKNFSAIIGPNGSGKSNVIDSLLFVFGFRASSIRSKKISSLIHSSNGKENINYCYVQINFVKIFDIDEINFKIIPNTAFSIGRYAYQDNSSKYCYNGKMKQYNDIKMLLKKEGIDLEHNRFLILQGEVELLALMPPKGKKEGETGMLEYLEDIIGSNRYKEFIDKLVAGIEDLSVKKNLFMVRFQRIEEEKNKLTEDAKECICYIKAQNAQSFFSNVKFHIEMFKEMDSRDEKKQQLDILNEETKECEAKIKELDKSQTAEKEKLKQLQGEIDAVISEGDRLKNNLKNEGEKRKKAEADILKFETKLNDSSKALAKEQKKLSELVSAPENCDKKISELQKELEEYEKIIEEKSVIVDESLLKFEKMSAEFAERLKEPESIVNELKLKESEACNELALARQNHSNLVAQNKAGEEDLSNIKNSIATTENELKTLVKSLAESTETLSKCKEELSEKEKKLEEIEIEDQELDPIVKELKVKKDLIEEQKQSRQSQNKVVDALMTFKHLKKIDGIFGRLGDLGGIDPKYDFAITAACRNQLDFIVVDTTETAQACIKYLKETKGGRASMLILSEQVKRFSKHIGPIKVPKNSQRLFDLIECNDNKLRCAFYFALRDTLVCNDIDTARKVGLEGEKRWKVVSLKGEIVEVSGVMTGGGKKPEGGKMGRSAKVVTSSQQEENEYDEIIREYETKYQRLNEVRDEIGRLKNQINTLKREIQILETRIAQEMEKMRELSQKKSNEEEIDLLIDKIERLQRLYEKCQAKTAKARVAVTTICNERDGLYEKIVGIHEEPLNQVKNKKIQCEKTIKSEKNKKSTAVLNAKKCEKSIVNIQNEMEEMEQMLNENREFLDKNFKTTFALEKEIEANKLAEDAARNALKDAMGRTKEFSEEQVVLTRQFNQLCNDRDVKEVEYNQIENSIRVIKKKVKELKTTDISSVANILNVTNEEVNSADFLFDAGNGTIVGNHGENDITVIGEKVEGLSECMLSGKLPKYTREELELINLTDFNINSSIINIRFKQTKKIRMSVLDEFKAVLEKYEKENAILQQMNKKLKQYSASLDNLRKKRLIEFLNGYTQILRHLKLIYQMLTLGGEANLELVNSMDPFEKGIRFCVRPPFKTWRDMSRLSGGEKTLSSLALVFALHRYRPTPLYVMDEIDAALDFKNVTILSHFVKKQTKNAQFIIITLRNNMFELADRIIGICKQSDCTQNVVIDPPLLGTD